MERNSFVFYASYLQAANTLKAKDRDILYRSIIEYGIFGTEPELKGAPLTCWLLIKPQLDANNRKYENGKRGGRPSKKNTGKKTTGYDESETNGFSKAKPNVNVNANDNVNVNENVEQHPTAPPAAVAPHKGALGGSTVLDSSISTKRDSETEAARQKFLDSIKRPEWPAVKAAPPDIEKEE